MTDPAATWIKFEHRSPTKEELNTDRLVGYFRIRDLTGKIISDHFGKLSWDEDTGTWAIEVFSNALRLTSPGQFTQESIEPSHWCLVPPLPNHPDIDGLPEN